MPCDGGRFFIIFCCQGTKKSRDSGLETIFLCDYLLYLIRIISKIICAKRNTGVTQKNSFQKKPCTWYYVCAYRVARARAKPVFSGQVITFANLYFERILFDLKHIIIWQIVWRKVLTIPAGYVMLAFKEDLTMEAMVKSTINISAQLKNDLAGYVDKGVIASFSNGVNTAIELYLKELRRQEYDAALAKAGKDKAFLARTLECQNELDKYDGGLVGEW